MSSAALLLMLAAAGLQFHVTDARGKDMGGGVIVTGDSDASGWQSLRIEKAKGAAVLVWPIEAVAAPPDGPEAIPVVVIQRGDAKALENPRVVAEIATPILLGFSTLEQQSRVTGFDSAVLEKAIAALAYSRAPFEQGVGLLFANKPEEAADRLAQALRERQRQLTRFPSEIYPMAMLDGHALFAAGKFDAAAVAYLVAVKQRPSDERARKARSAALIKAGKPDAVE